MNNKDTISKIIDSISELGLKKIFLFGSQAKGIAKQDSDFDLCIIIKNENDKNEFLDLAYLKMWELKIPVDLVVYYEDEFNSQVELVNSIPNEVLSTGLQVYAA